MYYDASSSDYISTPSFAIPNTGILTVEAWMKSKLDTTILQSILGNGTNSPTIGMLFLYRPANGYSLAHYYANGDIITTATFANFFPTPDNQWIHIVVVCDYNNKTAKAYRNGVQIDGTKTLTSVPVFPSTNTPKYIGS
jgi:hypothetical protein